MNKKDKENKLTSTEALNEALDTLTRMREVDKEKGYKQIVEPIKNSNLSMSYVKRHISIEHIIGVAATIAILFIVGIIAFHQIDSVENDSKELIKPGFDKAQLILSNGSKIELKREHNPQSNIIDNGTIISSSDGTLTYNRVDTNNYHKKMNAVIIPRGGEYDVLLEDGTHVFLNAETTLKFPTIFENNNRTVYLEGEAYFEVKPDSCRPFIVISHDQSIKVLGTKFNVCAYADESLIYTTLVSGCVQVTSTITQKKYILQPGEQSVTNTMDGNVSINSVNTDQYTSWMSEMFVFEDQNLEQIMQKLSRWYDVDVFYANQEAKKTIFKGNIPKYSDFNTVLSIIEYSSDIQFSVKNRTLTVNIK